MTKLPSLPVFLILISAGALAFAFIAEYVFGIEPCILCWYERYVYVALLLAALSSFVIKAPGIPLNAALLVLAVGLGLTLFHIGVEMHWWQGTAACRGNAGLPHPKTLEELKAQMALAKIPRCDQVGWWIFGVSATVWNFLLLGFLTILVSINLCQTSPKSSVK